MTEANHKSEDEAAAIYERALALGQQRRFEEAFELFSKISERRPQVLSEIAYFYYARGDNKSAMHYLKQYVARFPEDPGGWVLMARIERERNVRGAAARYASRACDADPKDAQLLFELGEILLSGRDWRGAIRAYDKCLQIDPQFNKAQLRLQLVRRLKGTGPLRRLAQFPPIRALLRWTLSSALVSEILKRVTGIPAYDSRWQMPLETDAHMLANDTVPADQAPDRFVAHFEQCQCPFWKWFDTLGIESPVGRILEIGTGPGHIAHHFARWGSESKSPSFQMLTITPSEFARRDRERRGICAIKGDFHTVSQNGSSFDLIVADYALQYSRAPLFALWEWRRLLRPDGHLVLLAHLAVDQSNPGFNSEQGPADADDDRRPHCSFGTPGHILTLTYWQLRWFLKQAGFQILAETLEEPQRQSLESVEHVDGRQPADLVRHWNVFFLLRKPGRLPYDRSLERPRALASAPEKP